MTESNQIVIVLVVALTAGGYSLILSDKLRDRDEARDAPAAQCTAARF